MFNLFKKSTASVFQKHFNEISALSCVSKSKAHKPLTAAYLFVVSDYTLMCVGKMSARNEKAREIFSVLESGLLSPNELKLFDRCIELFGQVIRGVTTARGDWCLMDKPSDNAIINLYLCFGDLLKFPEYIDDYENSPTTILGIDELIDFSEQFNEVLKTTMSYADSIGRG
jgi:hypothetical protein